MKTTTLKKLFSVVFLFCSMMAVQAGNLIDSSENLALGKTAIAGAGQGNNSPDKAIDGDDNSYWQADILENEWWYIDLEKVYNLATIKIRWENSYGKAFELYTAIDDPTGNEAAWTLVKTVDRMLDFSGNNFYEEELVFTKQARYIRYKTLERGWSDYAVAIREFRIFGVSEYSQVSVPEFSGVALAGIEEIKGGEEASLTIVPLDQENNIYSGSVTTVDNVTVTPDNGGLVIEERDGIYYMVARDMGTYTINAQVTVDGVTRTGSKTITVIEDPRVVEITISKIYPLEAAVVGGRAIELTVTCKDQYNNNINPEITWVTGGNGSVTNNRYSPDQKGMVTLKATSQTKAGLVESNEIIINVISDHENVALDKTVTAIDGSTGHQNAVDGKIETEWIMPHVPESNNIYDAWLSIDLEEVHNIHLVEVWWEGACSADFTIDFSSTGTDDADFVSHHTFTDQPGMSTIVQQGHGSVIPARHVRIYSTKAATNYGVKVKEVFVYGETAIPTSLTNIAGEDIEIYTDLQEKAIRISEVVNQVNIYSVQGQAVLMDQNTDRVDIASLNNGFYIVNVIDANGNQKNVKITVR
ncbi:MAG: discoidin domain-containing protein [Candidatus Azobacteroides sp.]|nr:discoidin domain-containing protein [Candidatus Azobacteroides sp.]